MNSQTNRASATLESLRGREAQFREGIKENHLMCELLAQSLGGKELEEVLLQGCEAQEVKAFLKEQKERLKAIAAQNVENDRFVSNFCATMTDVRNEVLQHDNNTSTDADKGVTKNLDERIQEIMNAKQAQSRSRDIQTEKYYQDIIAALGEDGNDAEDEDADIVIQQTAGGTQSLNCPISLQLMENPVRSKTCKHSYSREGILAMIGNRRACQCPIAGCSNGNLSKSDLEEDKQMERLIKREKLRQQERQASQYTQTIDSDDE